MVVMVRREEMSSALQKSESVSRIQDVKKGKGTHEYADEIDCCRVEDERDARIEYLRNIRSSSIREVLIVEIDD